MTVAIKKKSKPNKEGKKETLESEYVSHNHQVVVQEVIDVHIVFDGDKTKGWVHTHGMSRFGMPELEMRNVPLFLGPAGCMLINEVCDYMLNSDGKKFKPGQRYQFGPAFFFLNKSTPIPGDEGHFQTERWMFEDVPHKCVKCASGEPHEKAHLH